MKKIEGQFLGSIVELTGAWIKCQDKDSYLGNAIYTIGKEVKKTFEC